MLKNLFLLTAFLSFLFVSNSLAIVIHVPGDYTTIQAAINHAYPFDEIQVAAATYEENITMYSKNNIAIYGEDPNTTMIDGSNSYLGVYMQNCNGITFSGFGVINVIGNPGNNGAEYGNPGTEGTGIKLYNCNNCLLDNNILWNIQGGKGGYAMSYTGIGGAGGMGTGITYANSENCEATNNILTAIKGGLGGNGGLYGGGGTGGYGVGIYVIDSNDITIKRNEAYSNEGGKGGNAGGSGGDGGNCAGFYLNNSDYVYLISPGKHNLAYNNIGGAAGSTGSTGLLWFVPGVGYDLRIYDSHYCEAKYCNFTINCNYYISSANTEQFKAEYCWWGGNPPNGNLIQGNVDWAPWLTYANDIQAPVASHFYPHPTSVDWGISPYVQVTTEITDNEGVDPETIVMTINSSPVTPTISTINHGFRIAYQKPGGFNFNDLVNVTYDASDYADPTNNMTPENFSFTVTSNVDSEPDGLPDDFENAHFGGLFEDPNDDFDNDGFTNIEEYNQGTNPANWMSPAAPYTSYELLAVFMLFLIFALLRKRAVY